MVAGRPLFKDLLEILRYSIIASPLPAVKEIGFSASCVSFLRDVLQSSPEDRPSAEGCLKKSWIVSEASGSEYSIGGDLYTTLSKIKLGAPDLHSLSDMVANLAVDSTPTRSL